MPTLLFTSLATRLRSLLNCSADPQPYPAYPSLELPNQRCPPLHIEQAGPDRLMMLSSGTPHIFEAIVRHVPACDWHVLRSVAPYFCTAVDAIMFRHLRVTTDLCGPSHRPLTYVTKPSASEVPGHMGFDGGRPHWWIPGFNNIRRDYSAPQPSLPIPALPVSIPSLPWAQHQPEPLLPSWMAIAEPPPIRRRPSSLLRALAYPLAGPRTTSDSPGIPHWATRLHNVRYLDIHLKAFDPSFIASLCQHLPKLVALRLSESYPARDIAVISADDVVVHGSLRTETVILFPGSYASDGERGSLVRGNVGKLVINTYVSSRGVYLSPIAPFDLDPKELVVVFTSTSGRHPHLFSDPVGDPDWRAQWRGLLSTLVPTPARISQRENKPLPRVTLVGLPSDLDLRFLLPEGHRKRAPADDILSQALSLRTDDLPIYRFITREAYRREVGDHRLLLETAQKFSG